MRSLASSFPWPWRWCAISRRDRISAGASRHVGGGLRALALALVAFGCGHSVTPGDDFRTPESIPKARNLQVAPGCSGTLVFWEAPDDIFTIIQGWHVWRDAPGRGVERLTARPSQQRSYIDRGEPADGAYRYWTTSVSRGGVESLPSDDVRFDLRIGAPVTPINLRGAALPFQVLLQWQPGAIQIAFGYAVYRDGRFIGTVGDPDTPVYEDNQVLPGRTYTYAVTSIDCGRNESAPSDSVRVAVPAGPLAGLVGAPGPPRSRR